MALLQKKYYILLAAIISLSVTVLLAFLLPFNISKYRIRVLDSIHTGNSFYCYCDLNNDSRIERVEYYKKFFDHPAIVAYSQEKIIVQKDFRGTAVSQDSVMFFDFDNNGIKEIVLFSYWADSLFCNIVEPSSATDSVTSWFIDTLVTINGLTDIEINILGVRDLNVDGTSEFVFSVNAGYSVYPRRIYALNMQNGHCLKSPKSYIPLTLLDDIYDERTSNRYFYGITASHGNDKENSPPKDSLLWFKIFNRELKPAFPPFILGSKPSYTNTKALYSGDTLYFITLVHQRGEPAQASKLIKFTPQGEAILEKNIQVLSDDHLIFHLTTIKDSPVIFIISNSGKVYSFDTDFNSLDEFSIPENFSCATNYADLNHDGSYEVLLISKNASSLLIYTRDLKHLVEMDIIYDNNEGFLSQTISPEGLVINHLQYGSKVYSFTYGLNPWRILSFLILLLIFGFLLINLIYFRSYRDLREVKKRREMKDKMVNLQLVNLSNQFNPHFTFNILNSIASIAYHDSETADNIITRYAKILRKNILQARNFEVPLMDELDNIREYCELEKLSQESCFEYSITCEKEIEDIMIPKTLVLGFVENAIKHGIKLQPDKPRIEVKAFSQKKSIIIEVLDNGLGIIEGNPASSTGSGFSIARQAISLYEQITGGVITFKFEPAADESSETFTRAVISIKKSEGKA